MDNRKLISISELFKKSFELYKGKAFLTMELTLIGYAITLVMVAVTAFLGAIMFGFGKFYWYDLASLLVCLTAFLLVVFIVLVNVWVQVALLYAVKESSGAGNMKNLLVSARGKIGSFFWVMLLRSLIVAAGFIFFIIPGIIFSFWFSLSEYAFVFEDKKGMQALWRSKELVKGYWWAVFGRLCLWVAIMFLISSISRVGFLINALFTMPFGIFYLFVVYEDLKRIKS